MRPASRGWNEAEKAKINKVVGWIVEMGIGILVTGFILRGGREGFCAEGSEYSELRICGT